MRTLFTTVAILLVLAVAGCWQDVDCRLARTARAEADPPRETAGNNPSIAVASSYLAAAAGELLGEDEPLVELAEPGMCPGHVDLRPSQVRRLRTCQLLVRFDFQQSLDSRLGEDAERARVVVVAMPGGLCEPASYGSACRRIAEALGQRGWLSREEVAKKTAAIARRMDELARWARGQIGEAGLGGAPVLASVHQAAFCRWLGLDVVATFSAVDTATPGQIDEAVKTGDRAGVRLVVANLPEGRQLADALADRLGAKVVVFDNFPRRRGSQAFDELVRANVAALVEAARP